jgi:Cupredoxin-like domain
MNSKKSSLSVSGVARHASKLSVCLCLGACALTVLGAQAEELVLDIAIQNHAFSTETLEAPAGQKFKIRVKNLDNTPEEFDSDALHREKLVAAGKEILINLGPLKPGSYPFKGDFHPKTAHATLLVR